MYKLLEEKSILVELHMIPQIMNIILGRINLVDILNRLKTNMKFTMILQEKLKNNHIIMMLLKRTMMPIKILVIMLMAVINMLRARDGNYEINYQIFSTIIK